MVEGGQRLRSGHGRFIGLWLITVISLMTSFSLDPDQSGGQGVEGDADQGRVTAVGLLTTPEPAPVIRQRRRMRDR